MDERNTRNRKCDHLDLCAGGDVVFRRKTTLLEEVELLHEALPPVSPADVDLRVTLLGKPLAAPLCVTAISGGVPEADAMNRALADVARRLGVGLGLGSMRPLLEGGAPWPDLRQGPGDPLLLLGNLGLAQAARLETKRIADLAAGIGADALCIHLNPAQEWFQPEGDRDLAGAADALARIAAELPVPLVVKETGCGIARSTAVRLKAAGVRHLDVAGAGGTSWIAVERLRHPAPPAWAAPFREWGVPTAASVLACAEVGFQTLIASGGVWTGFDAAKAIALGADAAGLALPVLRAWRRGGAAGVEGLLRDVIAGLRTAAGLCGVASPAELRGRYAVTGSQLAGWVEGMARADGSA